jgi:multidrug efflux system membrane fusion protein
VGVLAVLAAGIGIEQALRTGVSRSDAQAATEGSSAGQRGRSPGDSRGSARIAVVTAVAGSTDVPIVESSVGWVEPIASVAMRPRIDGLIVAQEITDGGSVKAGDVLFRLDDKALQATLAKDQAMLAKDQATAEQLEADLTRLKKLHVDQNATEQQVEQQQAALDEAHASIAGDQAQIEADQVQIGYTTIRAPIAGRVGVVNQTLGAFVRSADATPLLTITQMAPLRISFTAPERALAEVRHALNAPTPAEVRALDPDSGAVLSTGWLTFIDSSVDTTSGTVTLKAVFDNADAALWPGEYLKVEAELGMQHGATTVPVAAVQLNEKGSFVFLVKPDGTVAAQPVTVANEAGYVAVIASGLRPNEHVVVEGQLRLRDGSRINETVASASDTSPAAAPVAPDTAQ